MYNAEADILTLTFFFLKHKNRMIKLCFFKIVLKIAVKMFCHFST